MAISYGIIENHGGSIEIDSRPGEGTEFLIILPIEAKESKPINQD
jgi:two-component system NtrC family sensor kinase